MQNSQPATNLSDRSETIYDEAPERPLGDYISWGALVALGWLIYEVTARPSIGIVAVCAKFGWNDFLTAHWLLRTDPDRGRGRTCFWFYVGSGVWKITVAAFLITGSLLTLMVLLDGKPPNGLFGVGMTAIIGVSLLAVVPLVGVLYAHRYGVRVWVDSSIHESRKTRAWPPVASGHNAAMGLLFPALMLPIVVTAILTLPFGLAILLVSVFGEGLLLWTMFRTVCADSSRECWTDPPTPASERRG